MSCYLGWYDDDRKKPLSSKVQEAVAAYRERADMPQRRCVVALVGQEDYEALRAEGRRLYNIVVGTKPNIRHNYIWVGVEDV